MRKRIGYFEGSDAALLTAFVCDGHDTLPVSNGFDNHGSPVRLINDENRYDLLIAYVHKIYAHEGHDAKQPSYQDVFHICRTYGIPLLLEVPHGLHDKASKLLGGVPDIVRFVDPDDMYEVATSILRNS